MKEDAARKVVHASVAGVVNNNLTQCNYVIVAVCEDGTTWTMDDQRWAWVQLPEIPPKFVI